MFFTLLVTGNDREKAELPQEAEYVVRKYANTVYRIAFSHMGSKVDAEDVFQDVFLAYYKKPRRFNDEEHRKAWLIKTTVNCCKKANCIKARSKTEPLDEKIIVENPFEIKEEQMLWTALQSLPQEYLTVIELFYFEEMDAKQIGTALGISAGAVHTRLSRARKILEDELKENRKENNNE